MQCCYIGENAAECERGIPCQEKGMNIKRYRQRWEDPKDIQTDKDGTPVGFWGFCKRFSKIFLEFEICSILAGSALEEIGFQEHADYTGAYAFCMALTVCNLVNAYGITTGGVYLDVLEINLGDDEIATGTAEFSRWPHIS